MRVSVLSSTSRVFKNISKAKVEFWGQFYTNSYFRKSVLPYFHKCYKAIVIGKTALYCLFLYLKCCKNTYVFIVIISSILFSSLFFILILCFTEILGKCPSNGNTNFFQIGTWSLTFPVVSIQLFLLKYSILFLIQYLRLNFG